MEFWGVELKGDKPVTVVPGMNYVVHLSQATLTDLKKKSDPLMLYAKVGDQKLVIGVLKSDNFPQLSFDLVFEKEFELSHNLKDGCVHLTGYKSLMPDEDDDKLYSDFSDDEEALTLSEKPNGVVAAPAVSKAKPAAALADKKITEDSDDSDGSDDDDDEDDSDDESGEGDESDEEMDDAESSDEEEEETPVKSAGGKKRPASALKTPEAKKAKAVTPQKTDGKKSDAHVATPHPAKNAGKTPKSGAQTTCGSCKKTFNSQGALDSHTKAKHSAAK